MDGLGSDTMARQNLQDRLHNSVKQVQAYFGAGQEIATESDARVSALCVEWEMVLTHAAKKPKPKNSLRLTGKADGVSLWPLAKLCVSAEDLQRFYRLNHVKTELGRGRAWLRGAINERTLENYMHTIVSQEEELRRLYEAEAFLLDQECSSNLPIMAAGLSSIIFSISIDASYLNTPSRSVEVPSVPHVEVPHTQQPEQQRVPPSKQQGSSLPIPPAEDTMYTQHSFPVHHLYLQEADDDVIAVGAKEKKKKKKPRKSKSRSPHLSSDRAVEHEDNPQSIIPAASLEGDKAVPLKESASSSSSRLSLDSVINDDGQAPLYVALTTSTDLVSGEARAAASATALVLSASSVPLSNDQYLPTPSNDQHPPAPLSSRQQLSSDQHHPAPLSSEQQLSSDQHPLYLQTPLSSDQHPPTPLSSEQQLSSDQHPSAPLYSEQQLSSDQHPSAPLSSDRYLPTSLSSDQPPPAPLYGEQYLSASDQHPPVSMQHHMTSDSYPQQVLSATDHSSDGNMRTAMLSLSKMKDNLEMQNRELLKRVSELETNVFHLEQEREKNMQALQEAHSNQRLGLERENDLLREQLKKYVNIVQQQRRNSPSTSSSDVLSSGTPEGQSSSNTPTSKDADNSGNTSDKKLQEMAEMYADLIELNERLHRSLADKDTTVCSLVRLLREANIEVPLAQHELPAAAIETRVRLVEMWIPSVIRKGRGPDGFHVYQVFVSVKGVEWNVYRRYTEFRDFHRQLQKHVPEVATFNFPPKKAIGNKSTHVVEERRRRLQEYLRFVIKLCGSKSSSVNRSQPIINGSISKEVLVTIFPFFKEDFNQDPNPVVSQPPSYSGL